MYSMFSEKPSKPIQAQKVMRKTKGNKDIESIFTDETLKELKIGKLVQTTMRYLFRNEKMTMDEIEKMTQPDYSKQIFNANIPVLKEVPIDGNINELKGTTRTIQDTIHIPSLFMAKIIYYLHNGLNIYIGRIMKNGYLTNYSIS